MRMRMSFVELRYADNISTTTLLVASEEVENGRKSRAVPLNAWTSRKTLAPVEILDNKCL